MMVAYHQLGNGEPGATKIIAPTMSAGVTAPNFRALFSSGVRGIKGLLVASKILTPFEEQMRQAIVARDYDKLFSFLPARQWAYDVPLGKYSFRDVGGRRIYIPFSQSDLRKFLFSRHMNVQAGYVCSDAQKDAMVAHYLKASNTHRAKFPPTEPAHIYPIFPGRDICYKEKKSTWDKLKPIAIIATIAVGGIFLGKALVAKAAAGSAAKAGAVKGVLVGAGSKTGAVSLATKAGTAAALKSGAGIASAAAAAAGGIATGATTAGGIVGAAAKAAPYATKIINGANTVRALANGELPPPPISLGDGSLSDYADLVGTKLAERELGRQLSAQEAEMLRQEIEAERRYLAAAETRHAPVVNSGLTPALTAAQKTRADGAASEFNLVKILAILVPGAILLAKGV